MICVTCRSVHTQDLPDVVTLDHRCFGGLWSENAYRREIESPNSDLLLLEAAANPMIPAQMIGIGCIWAILEEAHITVLGIDPDYQRLGLGQWLLVELLAAASDRGLTHATLEVRQSNQIAQHLYTKFGFRMAGERRKYYPDGENALIFWKSRLQSPDFAQNLSLHRDGLSERLLERGVQMLQRASVCPHEQ